MCAHVLVIINNRNGKGRDDKIVIVNEDRPFRLPFDRATTKADPLVKLRIRGERRVRGRGRRAWLSVTVSRLVTSGKPLFPGA